MKRQNPEIRILKPFLQFALQKYPVPRFRDAFLCSHFDAFLMLSENSALTYINNRCYFDAKKFKGGVFANISFVCVNYSRNMIVDIIIKVVLGY